MRSTLRSAVLVLALAARGTAEEPTLRVAVIGDGGKGSEAQAGIARRILERKPKALFLLGDNLYDDGSARHLKTRFDLPYERLLRAGVVIRPVLGNHDVKHCRLAPGADLDKLPATAAAYDWAAPDCDVNVQLWYPRFGYPDAPRAEGDPRAYPEKLRYYRATLEAGDGTPLLEAFAIDSNTLAIEQSKIKEQGRQDTAQLDWLSRELDKADAGAWKILLMHHPFRTPRGAGLIGKIGGHGPEAGLGQQLRNLCDRFKVDAVFAGHNHFYARMDPEQAPRFPTRAFVSGGGGTGLAYGPKKNDEGVAFAEKVHHFVLLTLTASSFRYEVLDLNNKRRDCGEFTRGSPSDTPCAAP